MAIDKIKINTNTLKGDTESITQYLKNIRQKIGKMQEDVNALNSMWEGEANQSFNQAFQDDIELLDKVCEGIQSVIDYETTAKTEYDSCESKVADLVSSIAI